MPKNKKDFYLRCSTCGKIVSSLPFVGDAIVMAYIECPECISKGNNKQTTKINKEK